MAPRKRVKVSPSPTSQSSPVAASPSQAEEQLLNDPWTDEEEVGLFKGLIKYKPTGIHKHFRLLALHQYLLSNCYIHPANEHTKLPGIWTKLATLYDLEALDEREDARQLSDLAEDGEDDDVEDDDADIYSLAANKIHNDEFRLPDDEFGELKWHQRFAPDEGRRGRAASTPPLLPDLNLADHPPVRFTPSFSIEPSEAPTPTSRAARPKKVPAKGKTQTAPAKRRSARQAGSIAEDDGDDADDDGEDEDEDGAGGEEPDDDDDDQEVRQSASEADATSEQESTPARSTRASGRNAAKSRGGGRVRSVARSRARAGGR